MRSIVFAISTETKPIPQRRKNCCSSSSESSSTLLLNVGAHSPATVTRRQGMLPARFVLACVCHTQHGLTIRFRCSTSRPSVGGLGSRQGGKGTKRRMMHNVFRSVWHALRYLSFVRLCFAFNIRVAFAILMLGMPCAMPNLGGCVLHAAFVLCLPCLICIRYVRFCFDQHFCCYLSCSTFWLSLLCLVLLSICCGVLHACCFASRVCLSFCACVHLFCGAASEICLRHVLEVSLLE